MSAGIIELDAYLPPLASARDAGGSMKPLSLVALAVLLELQACAKVTRAPETRNAAQPDAGRIDGARTSATPGDAARNADGAKACDCAARYPTTLAEAPRPTRLVLDDTSAYFTACDVGARPGSVRRVALSGGAAVELASGPACPTDVVWYAGNVYVAGLAGDGVVRVPAAGGDPTTLVDAATPLAGLATDGSDLYATAATAVLKAPLDGGDFAPLVSLPMQRGATRPVLDEHDVYWADPVLGSVYGVAKNGGDVATLASGLGGASAVALAGSALYVAAGYVVVKIPLAGGAPVTLGTAAGAEVLALAIGDSGVYFTSTGVVWTLPLGGGAPLALASDRGDLDSVATDETDLFWTASQACDASDCPGRVERLSLK